MGVVARMRLIHRDEFWSIQLLFVRATAGLNGLGSAISREATFL